MFFRKIFFLLVFFLGMSGFVYFAGQKGVFDIRSVRVLAKEALSARNTSTSTSESASFLLLKPRVEAKLSGLVGQPLWDIDIDEVINLVRSESWIRDVQIRRSVLGEVKVWIAPRESAAVMADSQGVIHSIALDGSMLSIVDGQDMPDVPFFTGESLLKSQGQRKRAVEILEMLPLQGDLSKDTVSEIFYSEAAGFTLVLASDGAKVMLGQKSSVKKVAQVNEVLNYLRINSIGVRSIDSRLNSKVLVKRKLR